MIYRQLTESDFDYLASAREKGFLDAWDKNMLISGNAAKRLFGFIAQKNGACVGFITYSKSVDFADIEDVFVEEFMRKKGVATGLINKVIGSVKAQNISKIFLEVRKSNLSAINLYGKVGFKNISERKKYYADGEDALIFEKEL